MLISLLLDMFKIFHDKNFVLMNNVFSCICLWSSFSWDLLARSPSLLRLDQRNQPIKSWKIFHTKNFCICQVSEITKLSQKWFHIMPMPATFGWILETTYFWPIQWLNSQSLLRPQYLYSLTQSLESNFFSLFTLPV